MKIKMQNRLLAIVLLSFVNLSVSVQEIDDNANAIIESDRLKFRSHPRRHHRQSSHHRFANSKTDDGGVAAGPSEANYQNFLLIDYLSDGEMERRVSYNGITAKETSIGNNG